MPLGRVTVGGGGREKSGANAGKPLGLSLSIANSEFRGANEGTGA